MPTARKALRRPAPRTTRKAVHRPARKSSAKPAAARKEVPHVVGDGIALHRIDHLTIRVFEKDMEPLRQFYGDVLGLKPGKRPNFAFPGYWLYLGDRPVVHLAGNAKPGTPASDSGATLGFDHVSFRTSGLQAMRDRLKRLNVSFQEAPVPGFPLHQIFFRDPAGMKVELTFDTGEIKA